MADRRKSPKARIAITVSVLVLAIVVSGALINHWLTKPLSSSTGPVEVTKNAPLPAELDDLFVRALGYMQSGDYEQASVYWRQALEIAPQVPEVRVNLGFTLLETGDHQSACRFFQQAIDQNAYQANAYYGLAICNEQAGDLETALGAMKSFVHLAQPQHQTFLRKARSAIWEWESRLSAQQSAEE